MGFVQRRSDEEKAEAVHLYRKLPRYYSGRVHRKAVRALASKLGVNPATLWKWSRKSG